MTFCKEPEEEEKRGEKELLLERERNAMKHQMMLLHQKQKLLDLQGKVVIKDSTDNQNKKTDASSEATKKEY